LIHEPGGILEPLIRIHNALELSGGSNPRYPIDLPPTGAVNPSE
jgi:hypothetical protein